MREDQIDASDTENFGVGALAATIAELCDLARSDPDGLDRCDQIMQRFEKTASDRRQRASSVSALYMAVNKRMPVCAAKAHVNARLTERMITLQSEGRFDASTNVRLDFSR